VLVKPEVVDRLTATHFLVSRCTPISSSHFHDGDILLAVYGEEDVTRIK